MLREMLKKNISSQAQYVEVGYGQVEPNHLSAQRNAQIYAQLPAAADIQVLEQGQFVKYDYANEVVNFEGPGEWMMVYNEIKLYRDEQLDCEFAMLKDNYQARVYSPLDGTKNQEMYGPTRYLQGVREQWDPEGQKFDTIENITNMGDFGGVEMESVASKAYDWREMDDINNPDIEGEVRKRLFMKIRDYEEKMMPKNTTMVPRVFKTMPGDLYTTNFVNEKTLALRDILCVGADGMLVKVEHVNADAIEPGAVEVNATTHAMNKYKTAASGDMRWQVVKVYTMPDFQKGVKLMRIV